MTEAQFEELLKRIGYGSDKYPPNGLLNHWPSGKLYHPLSYYEIKELVARVIDDTASRIYGMEQGS